MHRPISAGSNIYRLVLDAMFVAIFVVLSLVPSQISWATLPALLCAYLLGPLDVITVVTIGSFIEQLQYGLGYQTIFWMIPWVIFGLISGLFSFLAEKTKRVWIMVTGIVLAELILSICNTRMLLEFGYIMVDPAKFPGNNPLWLITVLTYIVRMPQGILRAILSSVMIPLLLPPLHHILDKQSHNLNKSSKYTALPSTAEEAVDCIHSFPSHTTKPGLHRIRTLLAAIGNPQKELTCIHVAGTNGKGSLCAMLDAVSRAAGYRVGLFTSPYIRNFRERMRIDGEMISEEELVALTREVLPHAIAMHETPNVFEVITAIGFLYFKRHGVDLVVLEVGLGGRLDPTNIIEKALLSVITGIDLDHTALLGNTVEKIAVEKAGIIKKDCPCLFGGKNPAAEKVIRRIAKQHHAEFITVDRAQLKLLETTLDGTRFDFGEHKNLEIPLLGAYQPKNAATLLTALQMLNQNGLQIDDAAIRRGLASVRWPARFELLSRDPVILFDGGHNPEGVDAAVASIGLYFPNRKIALLSAVMADKDYTNMIEKTAPITERAYTVDLGNPRALPAPAYAAFFTAKEVSATAYADVNEALQKAVADSKQDGTPLLCLGSLYLYEAVCNALGL